MSAARSLTKSSKPGLSTLTERHRLDSRVECRQSEAHESKCRITCRSTGAPISCATGFPPRFACRHQVNGDVDPMRQT